MNGEQLKKLRLKANFTQANLAEMLDVSIYTISRWENDRVKVPKTVELIVSKLRPRGK